MEHAARTAAVVTRSDNLRENPWMARLTQQLSLSVIDSETDRINAESEEFLEYLVFWKDKPPAGVLVDPEAEARRLQENATLGRGATEGQTPTIQRKEEALFENIF